MHRIIYKANPGVVENVVKMQEFVGDVNNPDVLKSRLKTFAYMIKDTNLALRTYNPEVIEEVKNFIQKKGINPNISIDEDGIGKAPLVVPIYKFLIGSIRMWGKNRSGLLYNDHAEKIHQNFFYPAIDEFHYCLLDDFLLIADSFNRHLGISWGIRAGTISLEQLTKKVNFRVNDISDFYNIYKWKNMQKAHTTRIKTSNTDFVFGAAINEVVPENLKVWITSNFDPCIGTILYSYEDYYNGRKYVKEWNGTEIYKTKKHVQSECDDVTTNIYDRFSKKTIDDIKSAIEWYGGLLGVVANAGKDGIISDADSVLSLFKHAGVFFAIVVDRLKPKSERILKDDPSDILFGIKNNYYIIKTLGVQVLKDGAVGVTQKSDKMLKEMMKKRVTLSERNKIMLLRMGVLRP